MDWTHEMNKMLSVFEQQAMQSLGIMKLAFQRNGMPFQSTFKAYFLRTLINRMSETFDRFELKSKLGDEMLDESSDEVDETERMHTINEATREATERNQQNISELFEMETDRRLVLDNVPSHIVDQKISTEQGTNGTTRESGLAIQINDSDNEDFSTETLKTEPTDDLYTKNERAVQRPNINENYINDPDRSDSNFAVELDESNDSIEMIENQNNSTFAADDELKEVDVALNILDKTTPVSLNENPIKTTRKRHKLKQLVPRTQKRCSVCGYVTFQMGHLNRHMRTHTGEKPYRCDRCGRSFKSSESLVKHAAAHKNEFPFHCPACFRGFSLKAEAVAHENQCQQRHYECHICKEFVTCVKLDLIKHMRKHSGDKPFRCEICLKYFQEKGYLKRHLNNIHTKT